MSVLLYFNQNAYNAKKSALGIVAGFLQQAVTAYNVLGLPALSQADFIQLFSLPIDLIYDKMTAGQPILISGLPVDKSAAIKILAKPTGYDSLLAAIQSSIASIKNSYLQFGISEIQNAFQLDVNGNVILNPAYDTSMQEWYKKYATSDTAIALTSLANDIIDQINTLGLTNAATKNPNGFGRFVADLFEVRYGQMPTLNADTIVKYN